MRIFLPRSLTYLIGANFRWVLRDCLANGGAQLEGKYFDLKTSFQIVDVMKARFRDSWRIVILFRGIDGSVEVNL
jgi:hypothetical protein